VLNLSRVSEKQKTGHFRHGLPLAVGKSAFPSASGPGHQKTLILPLGLALDPMHFLLRRPRAGGLWGASGKF